MAAASDRGDYTLIRVPDDYPFPFLVTRWGHKLAFRHRVVMESVLGRFLEVGEVVHHIDMDRSNDSPANLRLYSSQAEHMRDAHSAAGRAESSLSLPFPESS
jgi:hypothetical protein